MQDSMHRILRRGHSLLMKRSFFYARFRARREFLVSIDRDKSPLIVYQMGKVGSSSVVATLQKIAGNYQVYQIHAFSTEWVKRLEEQYRYAGRFHGIYSIDRHVLATAFLLELFGKKPPGEKWKFISLVRDPVARNISAFFQAYPIYFAEKTTAYDTKQIARIDVDTLVSQFLGEFGDERHELPTIWFQKFVHPTLGIDVFSVPFERERGYQLYHANDCDLLILRFEDLNEKLAPAIESFIGVRPEVVERANISSEKGYAHAYEYFKRRLKLPDSYLDKLYGSRFARHFYTDAELAKFRDRWRRA